MSAYRTRDPVTGAYESDSYYTIEETISSKLKYVGRTWKHGAAIDEPVWQVRREITTGQIKTTSYANEAFFDQKWSERSSLFVAANLDNQFSMHCDGVNDRAIFGDNYAFDRSTAFSVSCWVWSQNISAYYALISKCSNDANTYGWRLYREPTTGKFFIQVRTTLNALGFQLANTARNAQQWYHVVVTYSGNSNINGFKIYIDGVLDSSFGSTALAGTWANNGQLEMASSKNANHHSGHLDEVSIWDKELTSAEVLEIYNAGSPISLLDHSAEGNLLSWWRMGDGDVDPTISDNKGAINGTMENGAMFQPDVP